MGEDDDEEDTAACAALEEAIRQEEALIRCYESELRMLKREERRKQEKQQRAQDDDKDRVPLEDLLLPQDAPAVAWNLEAAMEDKIKTECWELTQAIQGFVVDSVESRAPHNDVSIGQNDSKTLSSYRIQGHFCMATNVSATIHLTTEQIPNRNNSTTASTSKTTSNSRIIRLEGTLTKAGKRWTQAEEQVSAVTARHCQNNNMADWIRRLGDFLRFEIQQTRALAKWEALYRISNNNLWSRSDDSISVDLHPGDSHAPTFTWQWDWESEKDTVSMKKLSREYDKEGSDADNDSDVSSHPSPQGLKDLVEHAGSCERALELILETMLAG
ncbi:expressed unknown protein [Seminavis robusta]|uniref:Uncharacterized protein n=1 Tax=Seminavis robusta TaxID=568900 RepID=A0A9N8DTC0_9STRA|nr:expressed unknown protein [Seminavis robusta]|eukprot:Sro336_g120400.1 n/a (329) ;mRNA; r:60173-61159